MTEKKDNPGFVRVADCREKHNKIELALFGEDLRGGMVKDIGDIKNFMEQYGTEHTEEKQQKKKGFDARRAFIYSILGGATVALLSYFLSKL